MPNPITPNEAKATRQRNIPDEVIEVWNDIIVIKMRGSSARIQQSEIVDAILNRIEVKRQDIFDNGWLDIEPLYRAAGWQVKYDRPGYNENYEAYFEFHCKS